MDHQKSKRKLEYEALMALAARHRADRALSVETAGSGWQCGRGHAWDDGLSAAQNVRCMNCASQRREQHTERLKALAEERGGRMLSASYVDATTPLRWECAFGHGWEAQADVATRRWCLECMRRGVYDAPTSYRTEEAMARDGRKLWPFHVARKLFSIYPE